MSKQNLGGDGATKEKLFTARLKKNSFGVFASEVDTTRLRKRRYSKTNGATGWPAWPKIAISRLLGPNGRRRDFLDRGEDGATTNQFFATVVEVTRLSRSEWRRRDYPDQGGDSTTFQTEAETARPIINSSRPGQRRRNFPDHGGDVATFQTEAEMTRPRIHSSQPR